MLTAVTGRSDERCVPWLTILVDSIAEHSVSPPCKPTVQRTPGPDERPTAPAAGIILGTAVHTRALHRCFVSMRRACCAARSPRVRTRAHAMLTAARPRAPADNLPSVESNSPFARTRVADERVACEAMAAVGGAHAALVYLAAEGRAGGYDLCVTRGAAQAPTRLNPVARAALTCGAAAAGPYVCCPRSRPTKCARCVHARVERVGMRAAARTAHQAHRPLSHSVASVAFARYTFRSRVDKQYVAFAQQRLHGPDACTSSHRGHNTELPS